MKTNQTHHRKQAVTPCIRPGTRRGGRAVPVHVERLEERTLLSFGNGGIVITPGGPASGLALQSDGKLLASGSTDTKNGDFLVARYTSTGSLDSSFGTTGLVTTSFGPNRDGAGAIGIQPDGKPVAVGYTLVSGDCGLAPCDEDFALARYNAAGSLDASFGSGGKVTTDIAFGGPGGPPSHDNRAATVAFQTDGKIVAGGCAACQEAFALSRYNANGKLDTTFGGGGKVTTGPNLGGVLGLAIQPDGKIVAGGGKGAFGAATTTFDLVRYTASGKLDSSFGTNGQVHTSVFDQAIIDSVALQSDGKMVVAGYARVFAADTWYVALARYNANGTLDSTFDGDGIVTTQLGTNDYNLGTSVAIQSDGKLVVAGETGLASDQTARDFAVLRYNPNGSLDTSFGTNGSVVTAVFAGAEDGATRALVIQPDGKIVAGGFASPIGSGRQMFLVRYYSNGHLDDGSQDSLIPAPTALPQSSPTVTVRDARAVTSIVTIPAPDDARPHTAPTEAADQAIASLIGSEPGRRFGRFRRLDLDAELLADSTRLV